MSIITGAVCSECKQWHSHIFEDKLVLIDGRYRMKYICIKRDGRKKQ